MRFGFTRSCTDWGTRSSSAMPQRFGRRWSVERRRTAWDAITVAIVARITTGISQPCGNRWKNGLSSAFGSRAGDTFTKVTIYTAAIWILLIMFLIKMTQPTTPLKGREQVTAPAEDNPPSAPDGAAWVKAIGA